MAQQEPKGGSIVAISSISALVGGAQQCHYTPTKGLFYRLLSNCPWVLICSISRSQELDGVLRNSLGAAQYPLQLHLTCTQLSFCLQTNNSNIVQGTIRTAINKDDLAESGKEEYMSTRTPLGRVGEADDIAGPTVFLASDLAKFGEFFASMIQLRLTVGHKSMARRCW